MRRLEVNLLSKFGLSASGRPRPLLPRWPATKAVPLIVSGLSMVAIALLAWQLATPGRSGTAFGVFLPRRLLFLGAVTYALLWGVYFALGHASARNKVARCAVTTASILFSWGLVELPALLGLVDYRLLLGAGKGALIRKIKPWEDPHNRFDRELMYTRSPGERIVGETTGDLVYWLGIATERRYHVDTQYDQNGFRNNHAIEAASIALIGDSFVEAGLVPHAEILSTRLSQLLKTEVANLGLGGYGPQQELAVLRRYAMPLQPKLVVWLFFEGNDLLDVARHQRFTRDADAHLEQLHSFSNRSFTNQALRALVNATALRTDGDATEAHRRSCRLRGDANSDPHTIYFGYGAAPLSRAELASLAVAEGQLLEAQRMTTAGGAALLLVYVPIKFRVYEGLCEPPADGYARTWTLNDLPDRLARWSAAHDVAFLDLTAALKHAAHGELVYFPDDGHWNANGNAVAATAIADAITTHGWLSAPQ